MLGGGTAYLATHIRPQTPKSRLKSSWLANNAAGVRRIGLADWTRTSVSHSWSVAFGDRPVTASIEVRSSNGSCGSQLRTMPRAVKSISASWKMNISRCRLGLGFQRTMDGDSSVCSHLTFLCHDLPVVIVRAWRTMCYYYLHVVQARRPVLITCLGAVVTSNAARVGSLDDQHGRLTSHRRHDCMSCSLRNGFIA